MSSSNSRNVHKTVIKTPDDKKILKAFMSTDFELKGYSLYSRLVSSMFVWTPFPRGTCTPFKLAVAFGSGAVRPKPGKNRRKKKRKQNLQNIMMQKLVM